MKFFELVDRNRQRAHEEQKNKRPLKGLAIIGAIVAAAVIGSRRTKVEIVESYEE